MDKHRSIIDNEISGLQRVAHHLKFMVSLWVKFLEMIDIPLVSYLSPDHLVEPVGPRPGDFCDDVWSFPWR
jgi:hypothetical protein